MNQNGWNPVSVNRARKDRNLMWSFTLIVVSCLLFGMCATSCKSLDVPTEEAEEEYRLALVVTPAVQLSLNKAWILFADSLEVEFSFLLLGKVTSNVIYISGIFFPEQNGKQRRVIWSGGNIPHSIGVGHTHLNGNPYLSQVDQTTFNASNDKFMFLLYKNEGKMRLAVFHKPQPIRT